MTLMLLGYSISLFPTILLGYKSFTTPPIYQQMTIEDIVHEMNQEPAKQGVGYDAYVLRELVAIRSGFKRPSDVSMADRLKNPGSNALHMLNNSGYNAFKQTPYSYTALDRLTALDNSLTIKLELQIENYFRALWVLYEMEIEKEQRSDEYLNQITPSNAFGGMEEHLKLMKDYDESIRIQTTRVASVEDELAKWMGAPDWESLKQMLLNSYPVPQG